MCSDMCLSVLGSVTSSTALPSKILFQLSEFHSPFPSDSIPSGNSTCFRRLHSLKAPRYISLSVGGIVTLSSALS